MTAEWFTDEGRIVETAWGRFQDTPIFRSLAREHNASQEYPARKALLQEIVAKNYPVERFQDNG